MGGLRARSICLPSSEMGASHAHLLWPIRLTEREIPQKQRWREGGREGGRDQMCFSLSRAMTKWAIGTADSHSNRRGVILTDMIWSVRLHRWNIVCDLPSPLAISQFLREALGIVVAANLDKWKRDFGDSCADCDRPAGAGGRRCWGSVHLGKLILLFFDIVIARRILRLLALFRWQ